MMGLWQNEQRTLQGSLCSVDLEDGSYHSRLWWPFLKLMSSLWKMAAHWKGAAVLGVSLCIRCSWSVSKYGKTYRVVSGK